MIRTVIFHDDGRNSSQVCADVNEECALYLQQFLIRREQILSLTTSTSAAALSDDSVRFYCTLTLVYEQESN